MAYERINWQNEPSEATALNDVNLNKMDSAIYELDGKATTAETAITDLQNGKVDKVTGKGLSQVDNVTVTQHIAYGTVISTIKTYKQDGTEVTSQVCNGINVDSALSDSSTNPVQNKVVKGALDNKVDKESGKGLSYYDVISVARETSKGSQIGSINLIYKDGNYESNPLYNGIEVDSSLDGTSENPVQNKAIYDALNNLLPSKTVSGNPISISDASGFNAKALTVSMNPIQDLHGYDKPWVGGAGKNKFSPVEYLNPSGDLSATKNADGSVRIYGTPSSTWASISDLTDCALPAGQYTFSIQSAVAYNIYTNCYVGGTNTNRVITAGNTSITFTVTGTIDNIRLMISGMTINTPVDVTIKPMLASGTDTVFEPYSNICPISGRTEASVTRTGINQWDEQWEIGTINAVTGLPESDNNRIRSKNYIRVKPSTSYYALPNVQVFGYTANKTFIGVISPSITETVFTTPNNCYYVKFRTPNTYGGTYNNDLGINYPSTDTSYHAYQGETHTHQYGQTVYGGEDDFVNGGLDNEWTPLVEYDGSEAWAKASSSLYDIFYLELADEGTGLVADIRSDSTDISIYSFAQMVEKAPCISIRTNVTPNILHIAIPNATTVAECKAYLAEHNLQVCYKKATPTTIQTSAENISLLKGNNVVSTNADDIELKYSVSLDSLLS